MTDDISAFLYLISSVCFVLALRGLSSPDSARQGNIFGISGMIIAIGTTLALPEVLSYEVIIAGLVIGGAIGTVIARKIEMTALPQLVAAFHSLVGLAACFVAAAAFYRPEAYGIGQFLNINTASLIEMTLGLAIGAITFTGSIIAFGKLQGIISGAPLTFKGQHFFNAILGISIFGLIILIVLDQNEAIFWSILALSFLIGILIIIPIGGADMPVVISMLNSYSGWAACGIGFTLGNSLLIITGALVGSSGAILSYIMCKGMNRSFFSVILGGFGVESDLTNAHQGSDKAIKSGSAEDAAFIMENASSVIIVPGYGMAVAQAQHALREMGDILKEKGVNVRYAIHPVAGRMPGHMNVLLAEANVPYDVLVEPDDVNPMMDTIDVAVVIGANDVVNPSATEEPGSPIYGMPIIEVHNARTVFVLKRSMSSGFAGVQNPLFFKDNTRMLFGDAKDSIGGLVSEFKE